jgi:translocation and assembly module TamA
MRLRPKTGVDHALALFLISSPTPLIAQGTTQPPSPDASATVSQGEEPILPDDRFNARLPAIGDTDPEAAPGTPLPSIDAYLDQQLPRQGTAAELPPATEPAADATLAQPLPSLGSVTVPAELAADANAASEKPPQVRYTLKIEGFGKTGLEDEFRATSALEEGKGRADTAAMVQARAEEDKALAVRLLYSEGYYDATALASFDQPAASDGPLTAVISVTTGKRYKLGAIVIQAGPTVPPALIRDSLPLKTGDAIVAADVEGAEANVALKLPENGYAFTRIGERDILLDPATATGDYTLPVETGPRGRFRTITTSGKQAFDADHIKVIGRFREDDIYDSRKVDDLRKALVATGLFSSIGVDPVQTGDAAAEGTEYVDLHVEQEAGPPRTLAGELGYGTGQGFRAEGTWTHRNVFPPEGAIIGGIVAGTQEQGLSGTFRRSNAGKRDRTFQAAAAINHQDYDAYEAFTLGLSATISRASTPIFQKRWTYSYGVEVLASNETTLNETTGDTKRLTYFIGALPAQIGYDRSDDLLNPTSGYRANLRVSPEASLQGSLSPYVRATFDLSGYYPVGDNIVIAARTRLGTISGVERDDVAPSRRIYAGGGGSVRGFGYQELGPKDANADPIGGRSVNEFAVEGRYRFGNYGIVAFVDAGQVYDSSIPKFGDIRYGVGLGGRFYTNFGPFRADIAMPINRQPGESKFALYIGIGQAF